MTGSAGCASGWSIIPLYDREQVHAMEVNEWLELHAFNKRLSDPKEPRRTSSEVPGLSPGPPPLLPPPSYPQYPGMSQPRYNPVPNPVIVGFTHMRKFLGNALPALVLGLLL